MGAQPYKVRSITWGETEPDDFEAYDDEDAAELWCKHMQRNGNFSDGYPQDHELEVTAPDGALTVVVVDTDWEPTFFVRSRGPK